VKGERKYRKREKEEEEKNCKSGRDACRYDACT
jgi:hypothetical protein